MEGSFSGVIQQWYSVNKRDLPWRNTKDPYLVWLSEVILQQTQVAQGLAYYNRFTELFPTVKDLASAPEDKVLKAWQGLGYYSRARNLHAAAKDIVERFKGSFPAGYDQIRSLRGVGDYTASAIASIAFGAPHAVVDGNVYRVLSRIYGVDAPIDTTSGRRIFAELAVRLLDKKDPGTHNQAVMEFGALHCRPQNPACNSCIFSDECLALRKGLTGNLPFKSKKQAVRQRHFSYVVAVDKRGRIAVRKRGAGDIWQGLYEFPLIESPLDSRQVLSHKLVRGLGSDPVILRSSGLYRHQLTHQQLHVQFHVVQFGTVFDNSMQAGKIGALEKYPWPRVIQKFLDDHNLKEMF